MSVSQIKPTVPIPSTSVEEQLARLTATVERGFAESRANDELVLGEVKSLSHRVGQLEERANHQEERSNRNSEAVKSESKTNLEQDAALATVVVDVQALKATQERQLAILERLDKVAANPMVRRVAYAIGAALLTYLASNR